MENQKNLNILKRIKINSELAFLIIISVLIIGGLFIYEQLLPKKEISSPKSERIEIETGTIYSKEEWRAISK